MHKAPFENEQEAMADADKTWIKLGYILISESEVERYKALELLI